MTFSRFNAVLPDKDVLHFVVMVVNVLPAFLARSRVVADYA